ncbi:aminotransferase-like domain-containing protein [Flavimaricola marinus]|uniref:Putative HTH-type transcriptional regulator YdcR n=1 Tax=Flavimaricola marinus TaxID=1819565 RepID=A0A238LCQ5_9RHOB|nr:PLP-dependent aminotransferase family protein [Flavimaricola marinus]SMY07343.1 putative HTH-type transcriptional regulator YdcR [Flavimaricola marinus]
MIVLDTISPDTLHEAKAPKYRLVSDALRTDIDRGVLMPGQQLPPVRDLAFQLGVTPGTIARAYSVLTEAGYLTAGVGRGTFVADQTTRSTKTSGFTPYVHPSDGAVVSLLSPRLPDVGQVAMMREGMVTLAEQFSDEAFLRYPSQLTEAATVSAYAGQLQNAPIGPFSEADIVLSNGGQNGVVLIMQTVLTGAEPVVLVDELAYSGFVRGAELCRAKVVGVPWDASGPDAVAFEALVREHGPQMFCTSAEISNPLVRTTTSERRAEIARIAQYHGVHVLDDDCYRLRDHRGPSYRALIPDLGWHVASPSKSFSPALRIGFIVAPLGWAERLQRSASFASFAVSRFATDLYAFLAGHPDMRAVRDRLLEWMRRDVQTIVNSLGKYHVAWDPQVPFVWLDLPEGWRAGEFCQAAEAAGVLLKSAEDFALRDSRRVHGVRLALNGMLEGDQLVGALDALRELLDRPPQRISV